LVRALRLASVLIEAGCGLSIPTDLPPQASLSMVFFDSVSFLPYLPAFFAGGLAFDHE